MTQEKKNYTAVTAAVTAGIVAAWTAITSTPSATVKEGYEVTVAAVRQHDAELRKLSDQVQSLRVQVAVLRAVGSASVSEAPAMAAAAAPAHEFTADMDAGVTEEAAAPASAPALNLPAFEELGSVKN